MSHPFISFLETQFPVSKLKEGTTAEQRKELQKLVFSRLSYNEKLTYCDRLEHIDNLSKTAWDKINTHLGTTASSVSELIQQLGGKQFGHTPCRRCVLRWWQRSI